MAQTHVVGISDCKVSDDPSDRILTYALGSCVGVVLYDPAAQVGGMLHLMLPDSRYRSAGRPLNPFMYADTGVGALLDSVTALGAAPRRLVAKLAGGANMLSRSAVLDIGGRNIEAVVDLLGRLRIPVRGRSLGGTRGRSMELALADGSVRVRMLGDGEVQL
ncbi:MAG: chemoreceptor glutamine deamidase CheD [Deferrisomatales bacterium]